MSSVDLSDTLRKWSKAKEKLAMIEEKIEKYKGIIIKEMNSKGLDKISSGEFLVSRRRNTRTSLSRENVPVEIWKQYSTRSSYDSYILTKKK